MTISTKSTIKTYFETGDFPTQSNFSDFIDSCIFSAETSAQSIATLNITTILSANAVNANTVIVSALTGTAANITTVSASTAAITTITTTTQSAGDNSTKAATTAFVQGLITTGTWTPVLTFSTPGDLNVTYSLHVGWYIKIGRFVLASFEIVTSAFTHATSSGALAITGLPFAASHPAASEGVGPINFQGITAAGYTNFTADISTGSSVITVNKAGSAQNQGSVASADMPTGGTVILSANITYLAAS